MDKISIEEAYESTINEAVTLLDKNFYPAIIKGGTFMKPSYGGKKMWSGYDTKKIAQQVIDDELDPKQKYTIIQFVAQKIR